ncbi:hypothetical protein A9Q84_11105 [Halobacteriovorax marinus]|uniref:GDP-mannose pyrophosphatase n=1 Tax=Halobacteriovorax marinus TaxID=97084 RepID=A0A1Y5F7H6_9BACT|nr:hypothetical protein A9Q84_11105 [Halobacteriovorax marinus]
MIKKWKTLSYELVLKSFVFKHFKAKRESSSGEQVGNFDVLECPSWVNVVAFNERNQLILVSQYRHGVDDVTIESPAGVVDRGEEPLTAAIRELEEETGHTSSKWSHLGVVSANPAFLNNFCHIYLAQDCKKVSEQKLDALEEIEIIYESLDSVYEKMRSGEIHHSLFVAAMGLYQMRIS